MAVIVRSMQTGGAPVLNGTAGSLIAVLDFCLVTGAGWTKSFTGTNQAAYRMPVGTAQHYLAVDDTNAQNARVTGYESMSAVTTGTAPFPTVAQLSGGGFVYKSITADAVARPWLFYSDGKIFHFMNSFGSAATAFNLTNIYGGLSFGEFKSFKTGDGFNTVLLANTTTAQVATSHSAASAGYSTVAAGAWASRSHTQTGTAITLSKFADFATFGGTLPGAGTNPYPSPIDGGMLLGRFFIGELTQGRRGSIPGMWVHGHPSASLQSGDTITGAGDLTGRTFQYIQLTATASMIFETSDTWAT